MRRWLAVISDLHISHGLLDDFDAELEAKLLAFVKWFGERPDPAELVINGDFLDFVQAAPWTGSALEATTANKKIPLCFTERQSLEKLCNIEEAHGPVFHALRTFLADERHRLTILPGNHDPDFYWPKVQARVTELLGADTASGRLKFWLDRAYRPEGLEWLSIEHGHRYDAINSFYIDGHETWSAQEPPILKTSTGEERLYECLGTRFLIRYLNGIDARYPYVDNVKPFGRFLRIFWASAVMPGWAPLDVAVSVAELAGFAARARRGDVLADDEPAPEIGPSHPLRVWIAEATDDERKDLAAALRQNGFDLQMPLDVLVGQPPKMEQLNAFLIQHPDLISGLGEKDPSVLGKLDGTLGLTGGYKANETEDLYSGAVEVAIGGVNTVVMGHTHEPVKRCVAGLAYFNTGSWTRYYRFGDDESTKPWKILKDESYVNFPYSLRYVLVEPDAKVATLEKWCERLK